MMNARKPLFVIDNLDELTQKTDQIVKAKKNQYEKTVAPLCADLLYSANRLKATLPEINQMFDLLDKLADSKILYTKDINSHNKFSIEVSMSDRSIIDSAGDPVYIFKMTTDGKFYANCRHLMQMAPVNVEVDVDSVIRRMKEYDSDCKFIEDHFCLVDNATLKDFVMAVQRVEKELPILAEAVAEYIRNVYNKRVGAE